MVMNGMPMSKKGNAFQRGHSGPVIDSNIEGRPSEMETVRMYKSGNKKKVLVI